MAVETRSGGNCVKWLFVKRRLEFPRRSGHDVHTYEVMRGLHRLGHEVSLATLEETGASAIAGLELCNAIAMNNLPDAAPSSLRLSALQERFRRYWGIPVGPIIRVGELAAELNVDATVVSGLDVLPMLGNISNGSRIWYAGDEWVRHHLSLVRPRNSATWRHLKTAVIKGSYERAYASLVDRAWVVTQGESVAMRRYAGVRTVDVVPNGIDTGHFSPSATLLPEEPESICFWGRLDFEPNIDAVVWLATQVWPSVRRLRPNATFTIYGFQPSGQLLAYDGRDGVVLVPDLPDLRESVQRHQVVVLPFISGAGIKNKLLEAAALGRAIVASAVAMEGLAGTPPLLTPGTPEEWTRAIVDLMDSESWRRALGAKAREWVMQEHSWDRAAAAAAAGMERRE